MVEPQSGPAPQSTTFEMADTLKLLWLILTSIKGSDSRRSAGQRTGGRRVCLRRSLRGSVTEGPRKRIEIARAQIGHCPVDGAIFGPLDQIVAVDRAPHRSPLARGCRNGREADEMLAVAIDQRRHRSATDHINACAGEGKSLNRKIEDARRPRQPAAEPRLHG